MVRTAAQVRSDFIDYFVKKAGHTFVPSSAAVPHDDPTLLFTNAGMNQFKDVFLGRGDRPYKRAVNTQKCIRAGGKHNDLEDVGKDTYHHTFFEMLGNWSFGDYFKADAIKWAWDLLVNVWKLDPKRLHATYFQGDPAENLEPDIEARDLWLKILPADHVHPGNKKDNFWEMGDNGPCGPCSEIHYDGTDNLSGGKLVNAGDPNVIEIWNLVFIQFNRAPGSDGKLGKLSPLPAKHVDTGMGFERITRVIQHKASNYDTDLWLPIFMAIESHTGAHPYRGKLHDPIDIAYRVIADHIRCLTIAITDGARPSNEGRGYVLRRILRRAVRHAHQTLGVKGPVLNQFVPAVVESLGEAFPELKKDPKRVADVIREEEEAFLKTLDRGIELFSEASSRSHERRIAAEDAFKLHDTYGFPIDLTRVMAEERGMTVDVEGYERLMEEARERSRAGGSETEEKLTLPPDAIARLKHMGVQPTEDSHKYRGKGLDATVKAIWNGRDFDQDGRDGRMLAVILDRTNFYGESGGQVGDTGHLMVEADAGQLPVRGQMMRRSSGGARFEVLDTQVVGGYVLHIGRVEERVLRVGDRVLADVGDARRSHILANHTGTHMLNFGLREVLGSEVQQKGSLVAPDRLRFDFSHNKSMTLHEIEDVQRIVSEQIEEDLEVHIGIVPLATAMKIKGVRAVFGEKYPDPVRVVSIGGPIEKMVADPGNTEWNEYSIEFCGGTHLARTSKAQRFVILSEQALAAGVRRITALTGTAAVAANVAGIDLMDRLDAARSVADVALVTEVEEIAKLADSLTIGTVTRHHIHEKLGPLREQVKEIRKRASKSGREVVLIEARALAERADSTIITEKIAGGDRDMLLAALDAVSGRRASSAVMLATLDVANEKVFFAAKVPKDLIQRGLKAGDWVKQAAIACGGSGGGRPDMAQAGGKEPAKIDDAIAAARSFAEGVLK